MYQNVFRAAGRYEFEGEFRRWLALAYVNEKFNKFVNDIEDIPLHPELKMYFGDAPPKFIWNQHMDGTNNERIEVSHI
jgi:hypothetical protein